MSGGDLGVSGESGGVFAHGISRVWCFWCVWWSSRIGRTIVIDLPEENSAVTTAFAELFRSLRKSTLSCIGIKCDSDKLVSFPLFFHGSGTRWDKLASDGRQEILLFCDRVEVRRDTSLTSALYAAFAFFLLLPAEDRLALSDPFEAKEEPLCKTGCPLSSASRSTPASRASSTA